MAEWLVFVAALGVGALIGCVGIGGVLLVPTLSLLGHVPVHDAIAAAMFSYLFSGAAATWVYARKGSIDWKASLWLGLGAMPAAFAGAFAATLIGGQVLEFFIATLVIFAGVRAFQPAPAPSGSGSLSNAALGAIGTVVGFGSAMTGTGGPLLLVPLLVWLRMPILMTIGLSQAIQLPIAILATAANLRYGRLDLHLGLLLSGALLVGSIAGARLAHVVSTLFLTRFVGGLMLAVGMLILLRLSGTLGW